MGLKITRKAPGFDGNIVGGNTLTLRLPIGMTYHQVYLEYAFASAVPAALALSAAVAEIRVLKNGKPTWNIQGAELDTINQFQGRAAAARRGVTTGSNVMLFFRSASSNLRQSMRAPATRSSHEKGFSVCWPFAARLTTELMSTVVARGWMGRPVS